MATRKIFSLLALFSLAWVVNGQGKCVEQRNCGDCISAGPLCGWCKQEGYDATNHERCDTSDNLALHGCDEHYMVVPQHNISYDSELKPRNAEGGQDAIQLSPQKVSIKLRPNDPFKFSVNFRQAENYPVDLYYVMDLSNSMSDDKSKLAELGDLLSEEMGKITKNFHLGFGSFVDKETMPYISTVPARLTSPCKGCAAPYSFRNQLPLTDDTSKFKTKVEGTQISGNLDGPEGGFDAIMQAISCNNAIGWRETARKLLIYSSDAPYHYAGDGKLEVGWRNASRKMLVFSTDAGFHYAGDGKLGGIVTPNDGNCHLNTEGYYSASLNQDYPSIGQLSKMISDKKVNVIFAVTKSRVPIYRLLGDFIEGSTVGELANDSSNVVALVRDNYNKISSTVELKAEGNEDVFVSFKAKCSNNEDFTETAKCDKLRIGQNVTFEVSLKVTSCPADRSQWRKTFNIYPVGLTEKLTVEIDLTCECDCELPVKTPSDRCNGTGTYECGACSCAEGTYGKTCECSASNLESEDYEASCKRTNTSQVCENLGQCLCGHCECYPITPGDPSRKYDGKFCECNNYACDFSDGEVCGGPNRGICKCQKCECLPGFSGSACDCPISQETCRAKESGLMCNGKGRCRCGECICDKDDYYTGPTCEDCPVCPGKCDENKACVQCTAYKSGDLTEEYCKANCSHVTVVPYVEDLPDRRICKFRDDDDCDFYFTYVYMSNQVQAQRTKECPEPVNVLAIVLGVIAGIILVGLALLLIWKLFVTIHDRREFANFEKERQNARWEMAENPIYKQATSTFKNPTYNNKG